MLSVCSPQLGLNPDSILGGEVCDREILKGLANKGVRVSILLPVNKPYETNIHNWNLHFFPLSHFPAFLYNFFIIPYLFYLNSQEKIKVLRVHAPRFIGLGCLFFKMLNPDVKIYVSYHNFWETNFFIFTKFINSKWDYIFCDSQNVMNRMIKELGISKDKISYAHNGVPNFMRPVSKNRDFIRKYGLSGKIVLLYAGFYIERKNPLFLLRVLQRILQKNKNVVLFYVGEGPLKYKIIEHVKKYSLENNVIVSGPVIGIEKNKVFNLADIFVHPSYEEGFAITPLEAMVCKKPVVMNSGFSAKEVIDEGINGYLCRVDNVKDWADKINRLITKSELRKKMGENAYKKAKAEFNWKSAVSVNYEIVKKLSND